MTFRSVRFTSFNTVFVVMRAKYMELGLCVKEIKKAGLSQSLMASHKFCVEHILRFNLT